MQEIEVYVLLFYSLLFSTKNLRHWTRMLNRHLGSVPYQWDSPTGHMTWKRKV
jgi:hypothetical protein